MIAAAAAALLVVLASIAGFRLNPDTAIYAARGFHAWPAPLGRLAGTVGGLPGVVGLSAVSAAVCVLLIPAGARRWGFLLVASYWLLFPGVDAFGAALVLVLLRSRRRWLLPVVFAAHPVAALVGWPALIRRRELGLALCGLLTLAVVLGIAWWSGSTSSTDRYALPLVALLFARWPRTKELAYFEPVPVV